MNIKSEATIRRYIKELQEVLDSDDPIASRLAYFALHAVRRVTEDVRGWPSLREDAFVTASLILKEITGPKRRAQHRQW